MAMGTRRQRQRQEELWYRRDLAEAPGHPFYRRLNQVLEQAGFDEFCEARCRKFYHERLGRPSLAPGMYFRVMLIGFFEGIESERGIAWRVADSLCLREFLEIGLDERTPDHVTISRTRRLMETYRGSWCRTQARRQSIQQVNEQRPDLSTPGNQRSSKLV
jgi:transposase